MHAEHGENPERPIEILPEQLSEEALEGVIQNFILREGTDYGAVEVSYDTKVQQVRRQILAGKAHIVFDQSTETVGLLTDKEYKERFRR